MPNLIYATRETGIVFADSAQTPDATITLSGLGADAARISARYDLGAADKSRLYDWRATFQMNTAPVVGETIDFYLSTSDGTDPDGQSGTSDAGVSSTNKLLNMHYIGSLVIDTTSDTTDITGSGQCVITSRYISLVVHNNTADGIKASTSANSFVLTPVPDEIQ